MKKVIPPLQTIKFNHKNKPGFWTEVRQNVDDYFSKNNLSSKANLKMVLKSLFYIVAMVGMYAVVISEQFGLWTSFVLLIAMGVVQACIGFNVSHDAIHGAYSHNPRLNQFIGFTFNLIGANAYIWKMSHNRVHHTYTNVPHHDEDLEVAPGLLCLSPSNAYKPFMKYQHIYAFFLYSLTTLSWVFVKDYKQFFRKTMGGLTMPIHPLKEYICLFTFKAIYYALFIVIPLVYMDITWWQWLIGFMAMHLTSGIFLAIIFQLAHIVEDTTYPTPNEEGQIEDSWAVSQMRGTANFSTKNPLLFFLTGGLNFQVEHHLFPLICHIHYPAVSEIVERIAHKYKVPYNDNPTFWGAIKSHYKMLRKFGTQQVQSTV